MRTIHFDLPIDRALHKEEVDKLHSLIPYCGDGIVEWTIQNDKKASIVCTLSEHADEDEVKSLLKSAFQYSQN